MSHMCALNADDAASPQARMEATRFCCPEAYDGSEAMHIQSSCTVQRQAVCARALRTTLMHTNAVARNATRNKIK